MQNNRFKAKDTGYGHSKQAIDKWLDQYINDTSEQTNQV